MLAETVLAIADEMEAGAKDLEGSAGADYTRMTLGFAKQLRVAVKASGGNAPSPVNTIALVKEVVEAMKPNQSQTPSWAEYDSEMRRRAAEEARQNRRKKEAEEGLAGLSSMVVLEGGPEAGTTAPMSSEAPVGAKVGLANSVYVHQGNNKWVYDEAETQKALGQLKGQEPKQIVLG